MSVAAEHSTIAHTSLGRLRGTVEDGVGVWRGVAYARQPVGARRFLAPQPLSPWTGVHDAVDHGPLPPQGRSFVGGGRDDPKIRDEACLTVTVWSPDTTGSLPVMVWIPGGAFVYGAGQLQLYNGSRLAANGNVVVVNVTYRLGVFGGFELSDLGPGFDDNLCVRDQLAALAWVRDNIAAFGGDPGQVTVFGESAGATSVLALLASPAATGLFARAIAQSPALPLIADRETRARQARRFLAALGVGAEVVKTLPQRQLRRAAGQLQLESAQHTPTLAYGLTYGVDLLPQHPIEAARAGAVGRVPLIIGTNSHEASMFAWGKPPMLPTTEAAIHAFFARTDPSAEPGVLAAYPDFPRRNALIAIGSDVMFGAPTWAFADAYSAHAPTHAYRFDHTTWTLKVLGLGATHGSEIVHIQHSYGSYLGRKLHPLGRRIQPSVGRRMQRTWLDFATGGHPAREEDRIFPAREEDRIFPAREEDRIFPAREEDRIFPAREEDRIFPAREIFQDWPQYDTVRRLTRVIRSTRDETVADPDAVRRASWAGLY